MFINGSIVNVDLPNCKFIGEVIGKITEQPVMGEMLIIMCIDGTIPSDTYPYRACAVPSYYLKIKV